MAINRTWAERCEEDNIPPQPLPFPDVKCSIGGNSPTEVYGVVENTIGNTPMNRALGAIRKSAGFASKTGVSENPYEWIRGQAMPTPEK